MNAVGDITQLAFKLDGTALLTNKGHIRIDKFDWVEAAGKLHFVGFFCLFILFTFLRYGWYDRSARVVPAPQNTVLGTGAAPGGGLGGSVPTNTGAANPPSSTSIEVHDLSAITNRSGPGP